ncbi:ABC transporter substrate-binding protein [Brumicola pallidula]|uniref:ABC transporter substrate-binding protein n=1 Tax=Brumicola pallidula TaxID=56807 RepID=UPI00047AB19B|nr:ABC transporter substrate-binding protein [Glaciecola pallidula]
MPIIKNKAFRLRRWLIWTLLLVCPFINAQTYSEKTAWQQTLQDARDESVYFYAWGGDPQVNRYLQWIAKRVDNKYGINLEHVKLAQTSDAVSRVLAEMSAGNISAGQVDLLWINGLNFATMATNNLLEANWVGNLPNFFLTNPDQNPAMTMDFGMPTNGMEAPWGRAALTFYYNNASISTPPTTLQQLLTWSKLNPGRFTYAKPPDFLGLSFLKYALIILNQQQDAGVYEQLYAAPTPQSERQLLSSLWAFLDQLHPQLWRQGRYFVSDGTSIRRLVGDSELDLGFTFSASDIPGAVDRFDLPLSIRSYAMKDGSLSNVHFVTIPVNAKHKAGAKVVANFLMSIEAQAKKQQPSNWGDRTVVDLSLLAPDKQLLFSSPKQHPSALPESDTSPSLSEPHPQWSAVISKEWEKRYGAKQ